MPWSPSEEPEVRDARLDGLRDRAGIVLDQDGQEVARLFLRAETVWERTSGHLWWSTWSPPHEAVHVWVRDDEGRVSDRLSTGAELEHDLAEWARDVFTTGDGTYRVTWLDEEESSRLRQESFGLDD